MEVARRVGIQTAKTEVMTVDGRAVLVVERFDRLSGPGGSLNRIHQEDLAQALGSRTKYQSEGFPSTYDLFRVPGVDRDDLFDRLLLSWFLGNCDAHAKNYSILEPGTPHARLAPVYDLLSTECYSGLDETLAMSIGNARTLNALRPAAVNAMARRVSFGEGVAMQRLRGLADRVKAAVASCNADGLDRGPVRADKVLERVEKVLEWPHEGPGEPGGDDLPSPSPFGEP